MKTKIFLSTLLASSMLFTGCAYYSYPSKTGGKSGLTGTTAVATLAGAAGGGYVGNQINDKYGAPIGAAVGAATAGGLAYSLQAKQQREMEEAYEEGQRKGRAQVYEEWWSEHAILNDPLDSLNKKGPKTRQVQLPEGFYESVPYHNRTYEYIAQP